MSRYTEEELDELWEPTPRYTRCTCNSQSIQPCAYCEQETEVPTMTELKLQTLIDRGACQPQVDLCRARFGESVDITPELCESVASELDFEWAAENLLTPTARKECRRVTAPAYAEYKRVTAPAYAEYERVRAREFARQYIAQGGAQ